MILSFPNNDASVNKMSDVEFWAAIKKDDRNAFKHVYESNIKSMYNYGMKIYYEEDLVTETIQELFVDIWNQRKNLGDVKNSRYYLLKALRYKLLKNISKIRKTHFISIQDIGENAGIVSAHEEMMVGSELDEQKKFLIASKINKLPYRQREIISLYFFEDFSYEEISDIMCINRRSVYTLAWKAISNLRKQFKEIKVV
jgi:RNA polymerase sigma factor (sigma-70 family)